MTRIAPVARILLGLVFFVFGLNGFFHFLEMPPLAERPGAFMGTLAATGYMFPLIKATEVVAGLMLLAGRFVPLALLLLAPVVVNILAFHLVFTPADAGMSIVLTLLTIYLGWAYRDSFHGVLDPNARPTAATAAAPQLHGVPQRA